MDIKQRLRNTEIYAGSFYGNAAKEAADHIESLEARIAELQAENTLLQEVEANLCKLHNIALDECKAAADQIPAGFVIMPRNLTAENGAKSALSGEFAESVTVKCPECYHDNEDEQQRCELCQGAGEWEQKVPVQWDTIKRIYRKAVELLSAAPLAGQPQPASTDCEGQNVTGKDGFGQVSKEPTL